MREQALALLRKATGRPFAEFREGQWECIESAANGKRLLVVLRTGWGKSLVYFLAGEMIRERSGGFTLLISPLLSLMRNQVEAASRLGIRAERVTSDNRHDWPRVEEALRARQVDLLLVAPERLANIDFRQNILQEVAEHVGLFVVDEAHCISDWGHDFRPDYRRITRILQVLPGNVPIIATTATANNRVVDDICNQLGSLEVVRGPLVRRSLRLQNVRLSSPAARLAWLAQTIPDIQGSGIVYTLTKRDAERVASWLRLKGIAAEAYHSGVYGEDANVAERREELEHRLLCNELDVLVSTVALGMGFDKPDLGFVIHYQRPASVVHYYQQVGRAGRAVEQAYGILMEGEEDRAIADYFIRSAFPPQRHVDVILQALLGASDGLSVVNLEARLNLRRSDIEKVLRLLLVEEPSPITKERSKWKALPAARNFQIDRHKVEQLTQVRRIEQEAMVNYMESQSCLMSFLAQELDDPHAAPCGQCEPCLGRPLLPVEVDGQLLDDATEYLRRLHQPIPPRQKWPQRDALTAYEFRGSIPEDLRNQQGRALAVWEDDGWGQLVQVGRQMGRFAERLVEGAEEMVREWDPQPSPCWITSIPSARSPELVPGFANQLAARLGIPYQDTIELTREIRPQQELENSFQKAHNLNDAFAIRADRLILGPVLLVDDFVDSRWTLTVVGALLRRAGVPAVHPITLAITNLGFV